MQYRHWTGFAALGCFTGAMNLLVWKQDLFALPVLALLAPALLGGILWMALVVYDRTVRHGADGRASGSLGAVLSSALFLAICMVVYGIVKSWGLSWDLTEEGRRDLAEQTVQVLQSMTQEVTVYGVFLQIDDELVAIAKEKTERFLEQCQDYTDLLKVEWIDPQTGVERLNAMGVTHASTQGTIVVKAGSNQRIITLGGGSPRMEERDFTNCLINVLRNVKPKVCFLTGHKERDITDDDEQNGGSMLGNMLVGESYAVERFGIKISAPEVPADCSVLVINNPESDLHSQEIKAIDEYLERGGRLLLLLDPWRKVDPGFGQGEQMRPWLRERFGIEIGSDILISDAREPVWQVEMRIDDPAFDAVEDAELFRGPFSSSHPIARSFDQTLMFQAVRSVERAEKTPDNVVTDVLLRTPPDFWQEQDVVRLAETGKATKDVAEETGPHMIAMAAVRRTATVDNGRPVDARIVVVGDSDFAKNGQIATIRGHFNLLLNTFAWLSEREDLIGIRANSKEDAPIILSAGEEKAVAWVSALFTVQVVVLAGLAAYLWRRKNA
ncbi:MAG: Gldg family protein [Candidatus Hydrogenedentes bacterium]|nr:Gldg family protein [Candidatus Hydrogenedentota bacterium]